ncbi:MAG: pyridoxal phosphate-dependent aminotransferase [Candidatus Bathyarchaeia archaeon]
MNFLKPPPPPPAIREAMAKASAREEAGLPVIDFSSGNVGKILADQRLFNRFELEVNDALPPPLRLISEALKNGLTEAFYKGLTGIAYSPTGGAESVKKWVLKYFREFHGVPLGDGETSKVIATAGGQQALTAALRSIKPGTTVYLPKWEYAPASDIIKENGCHVSRVPLNEDLSINLDGLKDHVDGNSVFYISMPNNPAGYTSPEDLERVAWLMESADGGVVWDAPYLFTVLRLKASKAVYDKSFLTEVVDRFKNVVGKHYQRMCILSSISKTCLMAGLRFGFATAPSQWIGLMNTIIGTENLSSPTHSFAIGVEALRLFLENPITHEWLCQVLAERLTCLLEEDVPLILPGNGMFGALYVLVKTGGLDGDRFASELIDRFGIVTVSGNSFYGGEVNAVRISLVATPWSEGDEAWRENVKALKKAVDHFS